MANFDEFIRGLGNNKNNIPNTPPATVPTINNTPTSTPTSTPTTPQLQTFRDYATNLGYNVDWNPNQGVLINNNPYDVSKQGLKLVNGSYTGTPDQYDKVLKSINPTHQISVREQLEKNGFQVGYDPNSKSILVNGTPVNPNQYGFSNVNGRYMGSGEAVDKLVQSFKQPLTPPDTYATQKQDTLNQLNNTPQYQTSPELTDYMNTLLKNQGNVTPYNPNTDQSLNISQQQVQQQVQEGMAKRGMLYSGETASNVAQEMGKLIPQYESAYYTRQNEDYNRKLQLAQTMTNWDNSMYQRNSDTYDRLLKKGDYINNLSSQDLELYKTTRANIVEEQNRAFENKKLDLEQKQNEIDNAYKKMDATGVVDNESSKLLGLPVGSEVGWAKQEALKQKNELVIMAKNNEYDQKKLDTEYKNEQKLVIDRENSTKRINAQEQQFNVQNKGIEQQNTLEQFAVQHGYDMDKLNASGKQDVEMLYKKYNLENGISKSLGSLSSTYESNGNPGTIANNSGDVGGKSYGAWQIANNTGTLQSFINWTKDNDPSTYKALMANGAKKADSTFDKNWKALANQSGETFLETQKKFIEETHYQPLVDNVKKTLGLDVTKRSSALQDVIWSTAVQHGGGTSVVTNALKGKNLSKMTDADMISAIYKERDKQISKSNNSNAVINSVKSRYKAEEKQAQKMLSNEEFPEGKVNKDISSAISSYVDNNLYEKNGKGKKTTLKKTDVANYLLDQAQNGVNGATLKIIETKYGITNKDYDNAIKNQAK
jgi:hypothetical protein